MSGSKSRVLPVVRWLRVGAVTAGFGIALAAAPAVAWADDGAGASPSADVAEQSNARSVSAGGHRSAIRNTGTEAATDATAGDSARASRPGPSRGSAAVRQAASSVRASSTVAASTPAVDEAQDSAPVSSAVAVTAVSPAALTTSAPVAAVQANATPVAGTGPSFGSLSALVRLTLEDLITGTGAPVVTNPTATVTGLFQQILRKDPTAPELQSYLNVFNLTGVNGVVAGLYTSDAFRQNAVNNYYRELLGRAPTPQELSLGVLQYALYSALRSPESYAASLSLAGGREFYNYSASGGGTYGSQPTPTSYVNLLYRSMLGESAGPDAAPLVQNIQQGLPTFFAANQFVATDAYRTVKVGQIYEVLGGDPPSPADVAGYVDNWFMNGGLAGISQSLLATTINIQNIEAGKVPIPDVASAELLQTIMLSDYGDFVAGIKQQLQAGGSEADGQQYGCKGSVNQSKCNLAFYTLMSTGGLDRGIPNNALQTSTGFVQVSTLIPTQNNVDMDQSLQYPLRDPTTTDLYLIGGPIVAPGGIILTADSGAYVIDGHHRWSALYVMNPYTSIASIDLGYVPNPQAALKETQMSIGAREGYLPWKLAEGPNLFAVTEQEFKAKVYQYIWQEFIATAPSSLRNRVDDTNPASDGYLRPKVFNEFTDFLTGDDEIPGVPQGALTEAQQIQYTVPIQDYLWANVERMRQYNAPIPGATPRADMPQPLGNAYPPYLQLLDTGKVIYTMPAISSLG